MILFSRFFVTLPGQSPGWGVITKKSEIVRAKVNFCQKVRCGPKNLPNHSYHEQKVLNVPPIIVKEI